MMVMGLDLLNELESISAFVHEKCARLIILAIVGKDRDETISGFQRLAHDCQLSWCRETGIKCVEVLSAFNARSGCAPIFRFLSTIAGFPATGAQPGRRRRIC